MIDKYCVGYCDVSPDKDSNNISFIQTNGKLLYPEHKFRQSMLLGDIKRFPFHGLLVYNILCGLMLPDGPCITQQCE